MIILAPLYESAILFYMQKKLPLLLLLAVLAGLSFYFLSKNQASDETGEIQEKQVAEEILADCPYERDVCSYMAAQAKAMSQGVTVTTTSQMPNQSTSVSEMKMDGSGNFEVNSYVGDKLQSSMLVFEKQTYIKDLADGAWYTLPSFVDNAADSPDEAVAELQATYQEPTADFKMTKLGTEACGALTCDKYEMSQASEAEGQLYIWIDTKEHLARQMEIKTAQGSSMMVYQYGAVNISKPAPIKEMPGLGAGAGSSAPSGGGQMPSQEELEQMMQEYSLDR